MNCCELQRNLFKIENTNTIFSKHKYCPFNKRILSLFVLLLLIKISCQKLAHIEYSKIFNFHHKNEQPENPVSKISEAKYQFSRTTSHKFIQFTGMPS